MTLSAKPFWIIFTASIIILVEWLIILPISKWRMAEEIGAMNISYTDKAIQSSLLSQDHKSFDGVVKTEDVRGFQFFALVSILASHDIFRAVLLNAALLIVGLLIGILIASISFRHLLNFGDRLGELSTMDKICIIIGAFIGLSMSALFLPWLLGRNSAWLLIGGLVLTYLCIMLLMSMKDELKIYFPGLSKSAEQIGKTLQQPKLLDTNVIIDGRIADVCAAGFIEGQIIIPSFVLDELQHIADSPDSLRRTRGRRGLDILNQMRKDLDLTVRQSAPVNAEDAEEVDARLVKLAKEIDGAIVTNDFNLNKVAELQGVQVLNINELANALKPVVLPGEELTVTVIKEGKEIHQGVAYLDDGTMIVIEGARKHIGETVEAIVTSVLQTVAGKMIFANIKSIQEEEENLIDRNVRNYSGFRARKKNI